MIVPARGAELFYSTRGEGPVCLVLSAIGTRPYERQIPSGLSEGLKLVFVDLRASGKSTGEPSQVTLDSLTEDLEAVRVSLGVEKVAVLGHSLLGIVAIEYGRRRPRSVSHVIAVGTPPTGDMAAVAARSRSFFDEDASEDRKQVLRENMSRLPAGASMAQTMYAQTPMRFYDARFDAAPLFAEAERRPGLLMHLMGDVTPGWDVLIGAGGSRAPIFLAHGRYDYTVPHVMWEGVASRLPSARLEIFERSGHQPFVEEPDRFVAAVMDWMKPAAREAKA